MRIPGLTQVFYLPASALPPHLELMSAYATDYYGEIGASLVPMGILDGGTFDIEESHPSNSYCEKVTLQFSTPGSISVPHGSCIVAAFADGSARLVGSLEHQPTIVSTDSYAGPDTQNACSWQVELTAKKAAILVHTSTVIADEGRLDIIGDVQEITEAEIDNMITNLQ